MRRTFFYILIFILAFELGVLVFINFYSRQENHQREIEPASGSEIKKTDDSSEKREIKRSTFIEVAFKDLPCENEDLKPIWNLLSERTVSINTDYIEKIKDCTGLIMTDHSDDSDNDGWLDLNNDGRKEILIRSEVGYFCGNNCSVFWIFQKDDDKGYRKLFEEKGYMPDVKRSKTKGYKDIDFTVYAAYNFSDRKIYTFNGTEYVMSKCWTTSNLYKNKDGEFVEKKRYKTEYRECKETEWIEWSK